MSVEFNRSTLKQIDELPIPLQTKDVNPLHAAVIENQHNKNEILLIGCGLSRSSIFIFNKIQATFVRCKVDLKSLQKDEQRLDPQKIHSLKALNSSRNKNHILVVISYNFTLYYSIFDCESYQWIYFNENTNYIDEFEDGRSRSISRCNLIRKLTLTIAVQDYLIITGASYDHRGIHIFDLQDEMAPRCIHISNTPAFGCHGCVKLPNINNSNNIDVNTTNIRLLLFGGYNVKFLNSMHELEITFKILQKSELQSGQQYPVTISKSDENKIIKDRYTNCKGQNIEITIKATSVAWKWYNNNIGGKITIFNQPWYHFSYQWQNRWSNLILNLNPNNKMISSELLENDDEQKSEDLDEINKHNGELMNNRYLAVFGENQDIAVFDAYKSEWYLSKYKLPLEGDVNSLMDENGFLYLLSHKTFSRYYVASVEQLVIMINEMIGRNHGLDDIAMVVFKNAFLHRHGDRFFDWKYIWDDKFVHFERLFDKQLTKSSSSWQTVLGLLWDMAKQDKDAILIPIMSKWIRPDDLMENIHLLFDHRCWQVNDMNLLKMWIGNWDTENGFDNVESALLHNAFEENNGNMVKYLIDTNICNKNNVGMKNNQTGETWLDIAMKNESDEFVDVLINKFGYELSDMIHYVLKHDEYKSLEHIIENDIYSLDDCIELIISGDCEYNPTKCIQMLRNMMVNGVQNSVTYIQIQFAILGDFANVLEILLTTILKEQGIENIQSYRENAIVTFEFIFSLLKLCINNRIMAQCAGLLNCWLQIIIKYQLKYEASAPQKNQLQSKDSYSNQHPDDLTSTCFLCLKQISKSVDTIANNQGSDHCACDDYQAKRVKLHFCFFRLFD